jgi:sec-independent protein translocase protein TatA
MHVYPTETILAFFLPGHTEWLVLLVLGLLIFGRRLPEVGRSLGRGIVEFKRGIKGIDDDIEAESSRSTSPASQKLESRHQAALDAEQSRPGAPARGKVEVPAGDDDDQCPSA